MDNAKVFFSVSELKVMTAKHLLDEAGIDYMVLNKKDSAYAGILGNIEIYVDASKETEARAILEEAEILDNND